MTSLRRQAAEGRLVPGASARITRTFTREDVEGFGRLTRDYNPVHHDPRWAERKGFAGCISHGLLVGSMLCEPGGQWGWLAGGMSFRFRKPVYIGDTVTLELTLTEVDDRFRARGECVFTSQRGEVVLTGELWGYLPDEGEQALLGRLLAEGDPTNGLER